MPDPEQETKDDEVLEREGVEQELMQHGASEVGEELEDVQDAGQGARAGHGVQAPQAGE